MFTIVVDESGDTGLNNVQADPSTGPSQYFTMCAALFRDENRHEISTKLDNLPFHKRKIQHAKKLNHFEKVVSCKVISTLPVALLGVASNKLTLKEYLPEAKQTPTHFYNKVAQYLFERIGSTIAAFGLPKEDVRIVLEAREQQYSSLISFVESIQKSPFDERATLLRNIDRFSISVIKKSDEPCVRVADMGAHAIFCALRKDERVFSVTEPRYLRELSPVFLADINGRIVPKGLKPIHSLADLATEQEIISQLSILRNPEKLYHKLER